MSKDHHRLTSDSMFKKIALDFTNHLISGFDMKGKVAYSINSAGNLIFHPRVL
jgi:hypothetical protein